MNFIEAEKSFQRMEEILDRCEKQLFDLYNSLHECIEEEKNIWRELSND